MPLTQTDVAATAAEPLPHATLVDIACGVAEATDLWRAHVTHAPPATSIHVYSPPLIAMGYYDEDGAQAFHLEHVDDEHPAVIGGRATARALHPARGDG